MKILRDLGLDEKEISIYKTLLRTGNTTASKIAKETDIDRATCYRYIDSLINKGLISYAIENNVKFFQAAHPEKILRDLKEKETEYKKVLPELINLTKLPKEETVAEVYKGKDGLKTVLRTILREKENHLVIGENGFFQDILPIFFKQFVNECKRNKIKERILCSDDSFKKVKKYDYENSEIKALPSGYVSPTTTLIFGNKIVLLNWELPYNAVVISSEAIAKSYRNYFEILWKNSKKEKK
jgi:HTH-type transcriptional regulator, sugar sensing transcriptional regulator